MLPTRGDTLVIRTICSIRHRAPHVNGDVIGNPLEMPPSGPAPGFQGCRHSTYPYSFMSPQRGADIQLRRVVNAVPSSSMSPSPFRLSSKGVQTARALVEDSWKEALHRERTSAAGERLGSHWAETPYSGDGHVRHQGKGHSFRHSLPSLSGSTASTSRLQRNRSAGEELGRVSVGGRALAPHLHFGDEGRARFPRGG